MFDMTGIEGAFSLLTSSWQPWLVLIPGLLLGIVGGALPGVSGTMTLALVLPFTIYMDFLTAVLFLTSIFTGAGYGSSIPAILMGMPGSTGAVAVTFDGYPMAKKGRHNEALGLALMASVVSMLGSYLLLFLLIDTVSDAVLKLGPFEFLLVAAWGLTMIASLSEGNMSRGLMAGLFGILLGTVGISLQGEIRGTMGIPELIDGIPRIPALMGFLACSGLFDLARKDFIIESAEHRVVSFRRIWSGMMETFRYKAVLLRGSIIGVVIGAVPGVGASISNLLTYSEARRYDDQPDSFGTGNPKGVVAADSGNSSSEAGSIGTLLALGIPGGGATAVLLGAFALHNITGGPRFVANNKDIVYAVIFSNFAQGLLLAIVGLLVTRMVATVVKIPLSYLIPAVFVMATYGSYAVEGNMSGPITLYLTAALGWAMRTYGYSVAACIVGLLLGAMAENSMLQTYQISGGFQFEYLSSRPIAIVIILLLVAAISFGKVKALIVRFRAKCEEQDLR